MKPRRGRQQTIASGTPLCSRGPRSGIVDLSLEERRLRDSIDLLDADLEELRLTSAATRQAQGVCSAPACGSRVASRLRLAAVTTCDGFDTLPCKKHGLVPCKLCAAAASRPRQQPKKVPLKQPCAQLQPQLQNVPQRRARSAGACIYASLSSAARGHMKKATTPLPPLFPPPVQCHKCHHLLMVPRTWNSILESKA